MTDRNWRPSVIDRMRLRQRGGTLDEMLAEDAARREERRQERASAPLP